MRQVALLCACANSVIDVGMNRRVARINMAAALMAAIATLLYSLVAQSTHSPRLHQFSTVISSDLHSHEDGGHSHDDADIGGESSEVSDHHHADHTHDKAGLVALPTANLRLLLAVTYSDRESALHAGPRFGIERPPRA
ncbi:hypothetical protein RHECIAT_CH0003408 [Rhizobium etli CIAT 652]|uniref:Uncharacterized protein n=2 Tax=Rhizobium TaxID=379 RepID=B3PWB8_RHIE6|nr:hypothetical protein RHECIAT_CH0003408 [Rhizobium etli CIAT 652]